jgi:hypothetical protein
MKAMVLHDEKGQILSIAVTDPDIELELIPDQGQAVLTVDGGDLGLGDESELSLQNGERVRGSIAKIKKSMRVDVRARRLVQS